MSELHDIVGYPAIKCARVYVLGLSELQDILGYPAIKCVRVYIPELSELNDMTLSGCGTEHCTTRQDSSSPPCKTSVNRSSSTEGYALSVGEDWKMTAYAETCCSVWSNTCLSPCRVTWGWSDKIVEEKWLSAGPKTKNSSNWHYHSPLLEDSHLSVRRKCHGSEGSPQGH